VSGLGQAVVRLGVGAFWLYFASQKWTGVGWMRPLIVQSAQRNPLPGLHELLALVVAPNWYLFALAQAAGETVAGVLLVLGLFTRGAAWLGVLLAAELSLTVAFLVSDVGLRWFYYLAVLANLAVAVGGPGALALEARVGRRWRR
jgi:uncharacterized membrane protein YphA (DoxX/SURF4 family)